MWSDYMWETYKQAGGKEIIKMFHRNLTQSVDDDYPEKICHLLEAYIADKKIRENTYAQIKVFVDFIRYVEKGLQKCSDEMEELPDEDNFVGDELSEIDTNFSAWCEMEWNDIFTDNYTLKDGTLQEIDYKQFLGYFSNENLAYYTTMIAFTYPDDLFVPYYFSMTYNVLENIADTFGINLPPVPAKSDYKGRVWHYANICKALYSFRIEKGLTSSELCAYFI